MNILKKQVICISHLVLSCASLVTAANVEMDKMWGDREVKFDIESSERAALFRDGNYGMFIHWGLYSHLGGQWKGETFYGIGEWIKRQMEIPNDAYMAIAKDFNPVAFDAQAIVQTAKAAGMKYIIITAKHHEGFAMFQSDHPFNIVDATPFARDPMQELADACRDAGLGFGFYYSHNMDWTAPGGTGGPSLNPDGSDATFEHYFREKCFPQVQEICTNYGPLSFVWFDTPRGMPQEMIEELAGLVRETQPDALLCSRVGFGMGDYVSLGDMMVPARNHEGLWETCDTTNDSWSYAWYDENWKTAKQILARLVATVGRGGSYLLNVGPDGQGRIPAPAAHYLVEAGAWIKMYPDVVYGAGASPWEAALPWGDITVQGDCINLVVFDWPQDRRIYLPGLDSEIVSAGLRTHTEELLPLKWTKAGSWTIIEGGQLTVDQLAGLASVIELKLEGEPVVDTTIGVYPNLKTSLPVEFATVVGATKQDIRWMEKFGEWKHVTQVDDWGVEGVATWEVDVAEAGAYQLKLTYRGEGRPVWSVETDEGVRLQNQQPATAGYHENPFGILTFDQAGKHQISVRLVSGDREKVSLHSIALTAVDAL